jgi:hypothetical protein
MTLLEDVAAVGATAPGQFRSHLEGAVSASSSIADLATMVAIGLLFS